MLTADEKMNRVVFYQELPVARVKRAFFLNFAAIAYSFVMLLVGRFVPLAFWGGMAMLVLLVPLLAGNVTVLLGLQRLPMLFWTLNPSYLDGCTFLGRTSPSYILLTLRVRPVTKSRLPSPSGWFLISKDLAKYGAIAVPPARGLTIEQLRDLVAGYRKTCLS